VLCCLAVVAARKPLQAAMPYYDSMPGLCSAHTPPSYGPVTAGVLIRRVNQTSAAAQQLQSDDVLLSFDGQPIANDGTVPFRWAHQQRH